jgi:hypothetical protein
MYADIEAEELAEEVRDVFDTDDVPDSYTRPGTYSQKPMTRTSASKSSMDSFAQATSTAARSSLLSVTRARLTTETSEREPSQGRQIFTTTRL